MSETDESDGYITEARIAAGIVDALSLWSDGRYEIYLGPRRCHQLTDAWFKWFVGQWNVARNIRKKKRPDVLKYLNSYFGAMLERDSNGVAIDTAASRLRDLGLTAKAGKKKKGVLPTSMVSKVAFLFVPAAYVPMDRLGKKGLNALRGAKKDGGYGAATFDTYEEYLIDFNYYLKRYNDKLKYEFDEDWVSRLTEKYEIPKSVLRSTAFHRKVFDNVLMNIGRSKED